jgi:hypothetical protein
MHGFIGTRHTVPWSVEEIGAKQCRFATGALFHLDEVCYWLVLVLRINTLIDALKPRIVFEQPYVCLTPKVCLFFLKLGKIFAFSLI